MKEIDNRKWDEVFVIKSRFWDEEQMQEYLLEDRQGNEYYHEKSDFGYSIKHSPISRFIHLMLNETNDRGNVSNKRDDAFNSRILRKLLFKCLQIQLQFLNFQLQTFLSKKK